MSLFFSVEDVQVSCYRILTSLYALGTGKNIYVERWASLSHRDFIKSMNSWPLPSGPLRQLPALGQCLATLAGAMPVAFLEPLLNTYNPCSVFNTKSARERASESCVIKAVAVKIHSRGSGLWSVSQKKTVLAKWCERHIYSDKAKGHVISSLLLLSLQLCVWGKWFNAGPLVFQY